MGLGFEAGELESLVAHWLCSGVEEARRRLEEMGYPSWVSSDYALQVLAGTLLEEAAEDGRTAISECGEAARVFIGDAVFIIAMSRGRVLVARLA